VSASTGELEESVAVQFTALQVQLTATPESLPADGESTSLIQVALYDDQLQALADKQVTFRSSLGRIDPASHTTNAQGTAEATLTAATTPGVATVTVQVGDMAAAVDVPMIDRTSSVYLPLIVTVPPDSPADAGDNDNKEDEEDTR
jgi:hypothetical protein